MAKVVNFKDYKKAAPKKAAAKKVKVAVVKSKHKDYSSNGANDGSNG